MAPHSSTLAWKIPLDGGAWWAAVHAVAKSQTQLSDFTFTFPFHALEKAMAPHSSTLAWKIPLDGGAWWAAVHGVSKSRTQLSDFTLTFPFHALEKAMAPLLKYILLPLNLKTLIYMGSSVGYTLQFKER